MTEVLAASRIPLENYADVVGAGEIEELRVLAKPLRGRSIEMINSTAVGGGVAEILNRLVPLVEELDLSIRWDVMKGAEEFFDVTKSFHNALHGEPYQAKPRDFEVFLSYNEQNRATLPLDAEFMVIHDPQPAALIAGRPSGSNHWVWRCHIDLSHPNRAVWDFLEKLVSRYDGTMFSSPEFSRQLSIPQYLFYPAIDPLSEKNCPLEPAFIEQVLLRYQIDPKRPILTQISRFDRLKDPVGVIRAYRIVKRYFDCQLVLAGGSASDDPEGALVLNDVLRAAEHDPDIKILELPAWAPLEVNALQRASTIVVQKSLREGFGLTVSEALWKGTPVVAGRAGGIPLQMGDGAGGVLVDGVESCAAALVSLIRDRDRAVELGRLGREHVRRHFLTPRLLLDELELLSTLAAGRAPPGGP